MCACDTRTLPRDRTLILPSSRSRNPSKQTKPLKYKDSCVPRPPISSHHIFQLLNNTSIYLRVRREKKKKMKSREKRETRNEKKRIEGTYEFGICVIIIAMEIEWKRKRKSEGKEEKRKENRKLTLFPVSKRIRSIRRETKSIDIRNSTLAMTLKAENAAGTGTSPLLLNSATQTSEAEGNIYARRGRLNGSKLEKRKRRGGVSGVGRRSHRCRWLNSTDDCTDVRGDDGRQHRPCKRSNGENGTERGEFENRAWLNFRTQGGAAVRISHRLRPPRSRRPGILADRKAGRRERTPSMPKRQKEKSINLTSTAAYPFFPPTFTRVTISIAFEIDSQPPLYFN